MKSLQGAMMDLVKWSDDRMNIGIKVIDDEHKQLVKIINDLGHSIYNNCQKNEILTIINRLIDYSKYHFAREEKYFKQFNYENTVEHIEQHEIFINKFEKVEKDIRDHTDLCSIILSEDVFLYLIEWLLNHITGSDKKFVALFKKHGLT